MDTASINLAELPEHEYKTLIRERHLDSFGHVNNAQYSVLFEEARWEMISARGYDLKSVHETQVGTVILESTIRFKRELRLREEIRIQTKVVALSRKIITLRHLILKETGEIAAEATFTLGCFDLKERKLRTPTPDWLAAVTGIK